MTSPTIQLPDPKAVFQRHRQRLENCLLMVPGGKVSRVVGLIIESNGPETSVGEVCEIRDRIGNVCGLAEVVGFREHAVLLMPLDSIEGVHPGSTVRSLRRPFTVGVGKGLLGRVIDGLGNPIDDKGPLVIDHHVPIEAPPPHPLKRRLIDEPLALGIRAIDGLLTCGKGQRFGVFAGSGIGKSILMGMVARNTSADINVIGLIGERGREVREFIEGDLGEEGLRRSVVVAVTSDQPALIKIKGALLTTAIAEYFRSLEMDVLLMMDSITRTAMALREIGLAVGEPPTTRGYTPSVFAFLPKLLERTGRSSQGSVTALYTVLVEGDDMNEPVADAVRSILDGHIVLSRKLATENHYPAIDVLQSVSRVMKEVIPPEQDHAAKTILKDMAIYRENEDLITIGAYKPGTNPAIDRAISKKEEIDNFLIQGIDEKTSINDAWEIVRKIA